jgi:4-diphosphocytidyl-2-C-methyl-D-erythritol kinase
LTRDTPALKMRDFARAATRNDCEPVVRRRFPEVAAALDALGESAAGRLTGTGACVFASFPNRDEAEVAARRLQGRWRCFVVRGLTKRDN